MSNINKYLVILLLTAVSPARADGKYETVWESRGIEAEQVAATLKSEWVIASIPANESITFWDLRINAVQDSQVLLGVSSEFVFAVVFNGRVTAIADVVEHATTDGRPAAWKQEVAAGQAMISVHMGGKQWTIKPFSARDLQNSFQRAGRTVLARDIQALVDQQAPLRFWGRLRATSLNIATPVRPEVEAVRRTYLLEPAIIESKRAAKVASDLPLEVAKSFLSRLKAGDASGAGTLISPGPFRSAAQMDQLTAARADFARNLLQQRWVLGIELDSIAVHESDNMLVRFRAEGRSFTLRTAIFDRSVFVVAVKEDPKP